MWKSILLKYTANRTTNICRIMQSIFFLPSNVILFVRSLTSIIYLNTHQPHPKYLHTGCMRNILHSNKFQDELWYIVHIKIPYKALIIVLCIRSVHIVVVVKRALRTPRLPVPSCRPTRYYIYYTHSYMGIPV